MSKSITGPGLGNLSWNYGYPTAVGSWSSCTSGCGGTKTVAVTDSEGKVVKHTFGTVWGANDGQLLTVAEGTATTVLKTTNYSYGAWSDGGGQPFPQQIGYSDAEGDHFRVEQLTPQRSKIISQQGSTFQWYANAYDKFARPIDVTRSSSLGYSKEESLTYKDLFSYPDNSPLWVIGLPQSSTIVQPTPATQLYWNSYDTLGRLTTDYRFGFWQHIRTYNTDGTLATVTDGAQAAHVIGLSNWKRGVPQTISYPTGHSKSAVVNDYGRITSLTDEAGATTGYDYDALGRLKTITYPAETGFTYNATNVTFAPITGSAPYGLAAGTWKQTLTTGNLLEENYFDALWRPVISHRKDTGSGKERFVVKSYDVDGHTLFESYPLDSLSSYSGEFAGTNTLRDALSRPYQIQQSSELGTLPLTTYIDYLSGLQTKTTNPRGKATTVSYQAFDEPGDGAPVKIAAPIATTAIDRNVFGETKAITRSGALNGATVSATRSYVYDGYHRLCKRIDPESGATVMGYDAAGNIAWQAEGLALPDTAACNQGSVGATAKANFGYDARNRLLTTSYGDGTTLGTTRTLTGDGLPATVAKGNTSWTYTYNNRRLLTDEVLAFTGGSSYAIKHEYNANGDESYLTYPDSARPAQSPTAFGEQGSAGTHATAVTRKANGALTGYTFGNGIVRQISLNDRFLPSSITDTNPGAGTVYQVGLTYDANANVATLNDYLATTDTTAGSHNRTMGYDDLDRLKTASSPNEWGDAVYWYDPLDNLRTRTRTGQEVWTGYGSDNRINGFTVNGVGHTLTQDARGNITQRGNLVMNWDAENRLTSVTGPTSQSYEYDGNGRRALVHNADGSSLVQVYSSKGLLLFGQKLNASGAVTQNTKTFFLDGKPIVEINGSTASYLHTDALGSPVLRTDSSRAGTADTAYDPWGDTWTGNEPSTFGYTGHVNDTATGLVQMQQRYYDPLLGRFLTADPEPVNTKDGSNFNRYWYANNNPYRFTDPDGRLSCADMGGNCQSFGSLPSRQTTLVTAGAVLGGTVGAVGATACTTLTGGICGLGAPTIVVASITGGALVGGLINNAASWLEDVLLNEGTNSENKPKNTVSPGTSNPMEGEPGSTSTSNNSKGNKNQVRTYGTDGWPEKDVDYDHSHGKGRNNVGSPHAHDWGRPAGGGRPTQADRGPARPLLPGEGS
ncbi:hypothetical protein GCM10009107_36140 [Ideonella azotifigens]|uniref:Teneurin-like YD-shell domain-containing protein n=2 Tax=Ideonella azotifigens TaxID=513160 RepID=A0ABN1K7D9_9BURK